MGSWLEKITLSHSSEFVDRKVRRKLYFYLIANFFGIFVMLCFGITLAIKGRILIPIIDFTCSVLLILTYFYLVATRKLKAACIIAGISFMGFLILHLITGGTDSSGPIWLFVFPPIIMYLLGKRLGLIFSLTVIAPAIVILVMLYSGHEAAEYSPQFILRVIVSYLVETILFYIMEVQRSEAQEHVNLLSGLLPICSSCKKIRDDEGSWNRLEAYIEKRTDAAFSHSICPECSKKLYGNEDWYSKLKK